MVSQIKVKFENCYGIRKLERTFDFSDGNVFTIYAPNGSMKSSFALSFRNHANKEPSRDRYFPDRRTIRQIEDQKGVEIDGQKIFVIDPFRRDFRSDKVSHLLVNQKLKEEYDEILRSIDRLQGPLMSKLKELSGLRSRSVSVDSELCKIFGHESLSQVLEDLRPTIEIAPDPQFANIAYYELFSERVVSFLNTKDFKDRIGKYIETFDALIGNSVFLSKGFDHLNLATVQKVLASQGFFGAKHSLNLVNRSTNKKKEIVDASALQDLINAEVAQIVDSEELRSRFKEIEETLSKNAELRKFRDFLVENKEYATLLGDPDAFRQSIWISYLVSNKSLYEQLADRFESSRLDLQRITEAARTEQESWKRVISEFKSRFKLPFNVSIENQHDVILNEAVPVLKFTVQRDGDEQESEIDERLLFDSLSLGEQRAFYILNILFEVEARRGTGDETIFIVDDIADSFDYKNKYAIVQYLYEMSKNPKFFLFILTHNFDFYRTITARLGHTREHKLVAAKSRTEIELVPETYQNNPFLDWKKNLHRNEFKLIASIAFVRNLAEYVGKEDEFLKLTSLLHYKTDTRRITIRDLELVYDAVLVRNRNLVLNSPDEIVLDLIYRCADKILKEKEETLELEKKIVLAMASRLKAEEFMIRKINDDEFWIGECTKNQTFQLLDRFRAIFQSETKNLKCLTDVQLMTPEQIHINSFMYEPILDMSNDALKALYAKTRDELR